MSFEAALSGLKGATTQLDVIGDNIANSNTTGFKSSRVEFADVFSNSSLGSNNVAGSGVQVSQISRQFSQGNITFTDGPLDLAINGEGFLRVDNSGSIEYTRNGALNLDKDGFITTAAGAKVTGFQVDANNNLSGVLGNLSVSSADLSPSATSTATVAFNLDTSANIPSTAWTGTSSFGGTAPASTTYNNTNIATVYDSLGESHTLTTYFMKTGLENTWNVRVQIDGIDVSSTAKSALTTDGSLATAGSLTALSSGDLTINGTNVGAGASDGVSTSDASASAIAIAARITTVTGVTATAQPNVLNLGTFTVGALDSGEFQINNQNIVTATATKGALLTAINALTGTTGVRASEDAGGQIILTASDGRNIEVQTDGASATGTFSNFALNAGGGTVNQVKRGQVLIESASDIVVAGTTPANGGLTAGTLSGQVAEPFDLVFNSNGTLNTASSDTISVTWTPLDSVGVANGSTAPQTITIDMSSATQLGSPFAVSSLSQNGYTTGRLNNIDIASTGNILGRYSNGQSQTLGQVVLSKFTNPQGLKSLGGSNYGETATSGVPVTGAPGTGSFGLIQSGALEDPNVVLTDALVDLMQAQRNFQSNAQTIRTEDQVAQTIINIR